MYEEEKKIEGRRKREGTTVYQRWGWGEERNNKGENMWRRERGRVIIMGEGRKIEGNTVRALGRGEGRNDPSWKVPWWEK